MQAGRHEERSVFVSLLVLLTGLGAVGFAAWDAVATTLSNTTAGGPLTSRLTRSGWRVAHRLARRPTSPLLAAVGPLLLIVTVGTWLFLVWAGWTLIFSADATAVVSSITREPADWSQRAYFAGFTMFTLGIGDYVPASAPWQLATVFATISGLALTTAAITYLIPVVAAATDRSTQAASIAGLGATPHAIVLNSYHDRSVRFLEPVLLQLTQGLLLTAERHLAYPILHYFHPRSPQVELRIQLAALDDALILVQYGLGEEVERPHPAAISGLRSAIGQLLDRADVTATATPPPLQLQPLREAGLPVTDDASFAEHSEWLAEHRGRVSGYACESKWQRQT
jgi:hypothetical protein